MKIKLNTVRLRFGGMSAPVLPDPPHGPEDLAAANRYLYHCEVQKHGGDHLWLPPLPEEKIFPLVSLAYQASIEPEEGRFPTFRIVCQADSSWQTITLFERPIYLEEDFESLRRLAPACSHADSALWVGVNEGRLACMGILNVGPIGLDSRVGRPEFNRVGGPPMFEIRVLGPGRIQTSLNHFCSYELRSCRIRSLSPFHYVSPIRDFCDRTGNLVMDRVVVSDGVDSEKYYGGRWAVGSLVETLLSAVLRIMKNKRHGGAVVILPDGANDLLGFSIRSRFPASSLDLTEEMTEFWRACVGSARSKTKEVFESTAVTWNQRREKMFTNAEVLAELTAVDGCVVLDSSLRLLGFGCEITVRDEDARNSPLEFTNNANGEIWPYDDFIAGIGGTRHKSAARLCKAHAGMLVAVVSQDGDLRIFASSDSEVNGYGPLDV